MRDHRIIEKEFENVVHVLDKEEVSPFSFCVFLSTYLREMLKEMDDDKKKEAIIRIFMDG